MTMDSNKRWGLVLSLAGAVTLVSCGPKAPAAAPTAKVPAGSVMAPVEAAPDLSPVATPDDLVLLGRLARPRGLVETVAGWVGVPVRVSELIPDEYKALESVVAWNAPLEVAAVLNRHSTSKTAPPLVVVTVGLTSVNGALDLARDRGLSPTKVAPGVYRVPVDEDVTCAIAAALGSSPARLVCGGEWQEVEELLPYATRGLPSERLGNEELHLELRAAPLQRRYAQEISAIRLLTGLLLRQGQTDSPRVDRALTDLAYGVADELKTLALEIERVELSGRVDDASKAMELGFTLAFAKNGSFTAQSLQAAARRAGPPPESFWTLPSNADNASYSVGADPKLFAQLTTPVAELVDAYLEQQKAGAALRRRLRELVEALPSLTAPAAQARGVSPLPHKDSSAIELVRNSIGWGVAIVDARADAFSKALLDIEGAMSDRDLARLLKERVELEPRRLPKVSHHVVNVKGFQPRGMAFNVVVPASVLEALSTAKADALKKPAPKGGDKPVQALSVVLVGDGEKTFLAWAVDEKSALFELEGVRAQRGGTLKDVKELAPLAARKNIFGGYTTLAGILRSADAALRARSIDVATLFNAAPNHGTTPQVFEGAVVENNGAPTLRAKFRLPEGVFQDLGALLPVLMASSKGN